MLFRIAKQLAEKDGEEVVWRLGRGDRGGLGIPASCKSGVTQKRGKMLSEPC